MSKMDALRAMREARYAQAAASTPRAPARRPTPVAAKPAAEKVAQSEPSAVDGLCGHRNMSGRTCTREQGHSAKSHRYS